MDGAANYLGYPTFFKENVIHRIAISSVGAHQVTETVGRGVQSGSSKSLCVVNEVLYYKAREGVCAYDGSFPSAVGEALGDVRYHNAVGGGCGGKYYLSMQDGANAWHLFCYDTARGLWHREDDLHALCFTQMDGELYAIDAETKQLLAMHGSQGTPEAAVKWAAETGLIGYSHACVTHDTADVLRQAEAHQVGRTRALIHRQVAIAAVSNTRGVCAPCLAGSG